MPEYSPEQHYRLIGHAVWQAVADLREPDALPGRLPNEPADFELGVPADTYTPAVRGQSYQETLPPPESPKSILTRLELEATYNARQCIINLEARRAGIYTAEFGGSPSGRDGGTASGAYQWVNDSWQTSSRLAGNFYGLTLFSEEDMKRGAPFHASFASPYVQDLVTAFALLHPKLNQNQTPWTHPECYRLIGTPKRLRIYAEDPMPTPFIEAQFV